MDFTVSNIPYQHGSKEIDSKDQQADDLSGSE